MLVIRVSGEDPKEARELHFRAVLEAMGIF
jgi:hypothetical protein